MMEQQQDEIEIDLREVLFEILAHWKLLVLFTLIVAGGSYALSRFMLTPMYESTSQLFVLSKSTSITSVADIQTGSSLTNDYLVVAKDRPVVEQVIDNLGLPESYAQLSANLTVSNPSDTRILRITVTDPDCDRAKLIADEMANVVSAYIAEKMDQDPPSIISKGYADGAPVSPNIVKNTLLGALGGFVLALVIVVGSYLLNDTVMVPEDIESRLAMNVMGILPVIEGEGEEGHGSRHRKGGAERAARKKNKKKTPRQAGQNR